MWTYKDKNITCIEDLPDTAIGFVYKISFPDMDLHYIGRKNLHSKKTLPPLKGYTRKRKIVQESNWLNYYSSNEDVKLLVQQGQACTREILVVAETLRRLTYLETKELFVNSVLEKDEYLNGNILGKFFKGKTY
jgi:hypothetical protein